MTSVNTLRNAFKDESMILSKSLERALHDVIRDNAKPTQFGYSLSTHSLNTAEKKVLLSHMVHAFDYEYLTESPERFEAGMEEYEPLMQKMIDEEIDKAFNKDKYDEFNASDYYYEDDYQD